MSEAIPEGARCSRHPDDGASAVCVRCGDFLCEGCTLHTRDGATCCARCEPLAGEPFPWEQRGELGLPRAFLATFAGTIGRTGELFARGFRERSILPALAFGAIVEVPMAIARAALMHAFPAPRTPAWLPLDTVELVRAIGSPLLFVIETALVAAFWWLGLLVVGAGKRSFSDLVRAMAFVRGATAPLAVVSAVLAHLDPLVRLAAALALVLVPLTIQARAVAAVTDAGTWRVIAAAAAMVLALSAIVCGMGMAGVLLFAWLR